MLSYFHYYLTPLLDFKRLHCQETVVTEELSVVMSLCKMLQIFAVKENGVDKAYLEQMEDMSKLWFIFW